MPSWTTSDQAILNRTATILRLDPIGESSLTTFLETNLPRVPIGSTRNRAGNARQVSV